MPRWNRATYAARRRGDGGLGENHRMMNRIDTVIFDMDGTVLDTLEDLALSVNYTLRRFAMPEHPAEDYRRFFGNGIRYALRRAVPEGTADEQVDEMIPVFREHYDRHCLDHTRPYDGIPELMEQLKGQGYRLAIVSNKIDSAVRELNGKFFSGYVDVAIGERDGIRRKPAPDTVLQALRELGSSGKTAVYIGDSEVDLRTAENAGVPCITVLWGFRDRRDLEREGAVTFAGTPRDVLEILRESGQGEI